MTERNDVRGFRTGRKNSLKIFIALLFALFFVLFCGNMTTVHAESKAKGQIVMSIEKASGTRSKWNHSPSAAATIQAFHSVR